MPSSDETQEIISYAIETGRAAFRRVLADGEARVSAGVDVQGECVHMAILNDGETFDHPGRQVEDSEDLQRLAEESAPPFQRGIRTLQEWLRHPWQFRYGRESFTVDGPYGESPVERNPFAATTELALNSDERLFMVRDAGRMEAELSWLCNNNPTVCQVFKEVKRAKLSHTSAVEMALICLARENEDLRGGRPPRSAAALALTEDQWLFPPQMYRRFLAALVEQGGGQVQIAESYLDRQSDGPVLGFRYDDSTRSHVITGPYQEE